MILVDARRAALTLHALPEEDREWVLRRLDPGQQQLVSEQLSELQALGVVADERLVRQALDQSGEREAPQGWQERLRLCDAASMLGLLQGEPASLIARVLALGPWPWEQAFLEHVGPTRRTEVLALRDGVRRRAAPDEWLMTELARRCGSVAAGPDPTPLRPPRARGWLQRLQGL